MAMYQSSGAWTESPSATVGPMTEGAAGIAVIVLAILALAAISSGILAAIATIVVGVGLLIEAADTGIEYARVTHRTAEAGTAQNAQLGADVSVELLCGVAGIVLGVLALLHAGTIMHLLPAALVVFGAALLLAGFSATTVGTVRRLESATGTATIAIESELAPARGIQVLVGIAAIVLGILAFVLATGGTLLMVGLLVVGAALLATSANFTQSFIGMLAR
jgi:hypothetical protein